MLPIRSLGARQIPTSKGLCLRTSFLVRQTCAKRNWSNQRPASKVPEIPLTYFTELPQLPPRASAQEKLAWYNAFERKYPGRGNIGDDMTDIPLSERITFQKARRVLDIKYLRPGLFVIAFSFGVFSLLAFLQARQEVKPKSSSLWGTDHIQRKRTTGPVEVITRALEEFDPVSKLTIGIIGVNAAVHLGSLIFPRAWATLVHIPQFTSAVGRFTDHGYTFRPVSYTLLTSNFAHWGMLHFLFNMYACYNFVPKVGESRLFEGSAYHTLAFFLSSGVVSVYAQHLASRSPGAGASGALFAIFGAFCMQYPDAQIGFFPIPVSLSASTFLPCAMLFDVLGMVFARNYSKLGHAVS